MTAPPTALTWTWPADLEPWRVGLREMLACSVGDDGILGYARPPTPAEADDFVDGHQRSLGRGSGAVLVGADGDRARAMVCLAFSSMPNCRHVVEVSKAFIEPGVRGGGLVFALAAQVCAEAARRGGELLVIDVREGSHAHAVWTRMGFETFGVLADYARVDGVPQRGRYMSCRVAALHDLVARRTADPTAP